MWREDRQAGDGHHWFEQPIDMEVYTKGRRQKIQVKKAKMTTERRVSNKRASDNHTSARTKMYFPRSASWQYQFFSGIV